MIFTPQAETGRWQAIAFTTFVHLFLLAFLFIGVQWKRNPPTSVQVELWSGRPAATAPHTASLPMPIPETKPEPKPEPAPELKPDPKPEPVVTKKPEAQPEPIAKPDIAVKPDKKTKIKPEKPSAEIPTKPVKKEEPTSKTPSKPFWESALRSEETARAIAQEKGELAAAAAGQQALASWTDRISAKIRGNTVRPQSLQGNPVAIFSVELLVTGEIHNIRLKRSSGSRAWDEATERAIWKSSPLPKPDDSAVFRRDLEPKLCPDEEQGCR